MKIIDIGICVDNVDPKGIGRIRYRPFGDFTSEISGGVKYKEWDDNDPFVALPFLPLHVNITPQPNQSIKLIYYDTSKVGQNIEYISGPYTSPHDYQTQTYTSQHKHTTFGGVVVKNIKNIINSDGTFNGPVTKGAVIDPKDTGFRGNYGSDIVFTQNGLQLKGGSLLSKESKKRDVIDYPQVSKKVSKISLKKFPSTFKSVGETKSIDKVSVSPIKYIIEYEINDLTTPTQVKFFIYKVVSNYGSKYNSDVFKEDSVIDRTNTSELKLINTSGNQIDPTHTIDIDGNIQSGYVEIRDLLYRVDRDGISILNNTYPTEDIYPYYFRPTTTFRLLKPSDSTETINKNLVMTKVEVRKKKGYGLIYSRLESNPTVSSSTTNVIVVREVKGGGEQSFANILADKIYLTSTTPNVGENTKTIKFNELDEYEFNQEDYLKRIEPNTYSLVRGEVLYNFLTSIMNLLASHRHNINDTLVKTDENWIRLDGLMKTLRNELLNNSIKIN